MKNRRVSTRRIFSLIRLRRVYFAAQVILVSPVILASPVLKANQISLRAQRAISLITLPQAESH